ncbi:UDP-N-acetylmuramate--L-alanine ligase [Actinotalea sp. JY-7876]|uniref:UDP-N-acetylmuramate--L-alanine ligase n=1 Tax=Actinotalea sp. JY-7876 TaxID=2758442 RepID=UPI0015F45535|nr:UDP-N-acetylmuramate--L-alanine ligase [Actinotalea sp. JY-7876]
MSAVAGLLAARGLAVSGSDAREGPVTAALRAAGVHVDIGHDAAHVDGAGTVVVSTAIRPTNPELAAARDHGVPVLHRSEALAALMADRRAVAVAGAHGKTTTSAMVAVALDHAGLAPSWAIGGTVLAADGASDAPRAAGSVPDVGGGHAGTGDVIVVEADESDGSFLAYAPQIAVVTNIEPDHLDHYGTREAFEAAFRRFAARVLPGGWLVACADDPGSAALAAHARDQGVGVRTYGTAPGADVRVGPWTPEPARSGGSTWVDDGSGPVALRLRVPGAHMGLDAAAAWTAARLLGVDAARAAEGLARFVGTGRRFEDRGSAAGVRVVDDYAHHPTEVAALLRAARPVAGDGRVLVVFQPHLYSRTAAFASEFAQALDLADVVVVTDVYAAREDPDPTITGGTVVERMTGDATFVPDRLEAARVLAARARPGDLVLTVGAGDVTELGPVVLAHLAGRDDAS